MMKISLSLLLFTMTKLLSNSLHDQLELNDTDLLIQTNKSRINIDDIHFEDNGFKSSNLDFSMDSYLQEQDSRHNYQSVSYPTIDIMREKLKRHCYIKLFKRETII